MKYYLDTEFDGFNGPLISLALVREDNEYIYLIDPLAHPNDEWVHENVMPILYDVPDHIICDTISIEKWPKIIEKFLKKDAKPEIICDWPSDVVYFCNLIMTGPGKAITMSDKTRLTILRHLDVYPTTLEGAVQHNAWWDAMAIKEICNANDAS